MGEFTEQEFSHHQAMARSLNKVQLDSQDQYLLTEYHWYDHKSSCGVIYLRGYKIGEATNKRIYLHQVIMGKKQGYIIDHINGDTLDNRRENLRFCTQAQNQYNRLSRSGHKGCTWSKEYQQWVVRIHKDKQAHFLGRFDSLNEALLVYEKAAIRFYGVYARGAVWQGA